MSSRNKELKEEYKQMKLPMGVIIVKCLSEPKCFIESTPNLKGTINRANFELELGSHKSKELQKAWNNSSVTFETATVPGMKERFPATLDGIFRNPARCDARQRRSPATI